MDPRMTGLALNMLFLSFPEASFVFSMIEQLHNQILTDQLGAELLSFTDRVG